MRSTAEALVRRLHLSGFCGFDFILDGSDNAWLIEMNPRLTPTAHLRYETHNLLTAMLSRLTETSIGTDNAPPVQSALRVGSIVALFPGEYLRSRASKYLSSCYHDVPWSQPALVRAGMKIIAERERHDALRKLLLGLRRR